MYQPSAYNEGSLGTLGGPIADFSSVGPASNSAAYADGTLGNVRSSHSSISPYAAQAGYPGAAQAGVGGCAGCGTAGLGAFSDIGVGTVIGASISALICGWLGSKVYKSNPARGRAVGAALGAGFSILNTIRRPAGGVQFVEKTLTEPSSPPTSGIGEYFSSGM